MQTIKREQCAVYQADPDSQPVLKVKPGEKFKVETNDHFKQALLNKGTGLFNKNEFPELNSIPFKANPVSGSIYIEGAEAGDLLAVHIWDIIPDVKGEICTFRGFGLLDGRSWWEECDQNYIHTAKILPGPGGTTSDGTVELEINNHKWTWNCNPHIGTILTCTEKGRGIPDTLTTQGPWGGNQDIRDVCKNNTIYINCFNKGGLLMLGDVHASQGDSELCGNAIEVCADVILSVEIIKNKFIPGTMRIETPKSIIQVDSCKNSGTYEDALGNCFIGMMNWLVDEYGYGKREAYLHMSGNSGVRINVYQFVKMFFVCGVEFSKSFLNKQE